MVRYNFVSCPSVLVASPVVSSPTPLHHHLLKLHHLPSQRNFCVSFVFFPCLFLLLPPASLCSPPGKHCLFFQPQLNTFLFPAVPEPRKNFAKSLGKVLPNSGSYFDITFRVLPGLAGISGKQDRQHRFKLGCPLGFQLAAHEEESFGYDFLPPDYPEVFILNSLSPLLVESTI